MLGDFYFHFKEPSDVLSQLGSVKNFSPWIWRSWEFPLADSPSQLLSSWSAGSFSVLTIVQCIHNSRPASIHVIHPVKELILPALIRRQVTPPRISVHNAMSIYVIESWMNVISTLSRHIYLYYHHPIQLPVSPTSIWKDCNWLKLGSLLFCVYEWNMSILGIIETVNLWTFYIK